MLAQTRRRLPAAGLDRVHLLKGHVLELPFDNDTFDLVVNAYMLASLPPRHSSRTDRVKRVLKPGGRLVLVNMTKGTRRRHRIWDWLSDHNINLTANSRGVLAIPVLAELEFTDLHREYLTKRHRNRHRDPAANV